MTAIQFINVTKEFQQADQTLLALNPTNLVIKKGEFVAIVGPSGSGKSTFLTLAGGLQKPTSGQIIINQTDISQIEDKKLGQIRLKEIGFILQASNLVPYLKIKDQFVLFDKITGKHKTDYRDELLEQLDVQDLKDKYHEELSGGQRQRVALAKALYNDPTIILADEPTASLDTDRAFEVVDILAKEAKEKNKAIIMVTHDTRLIDQCDRVLVMTDGVLEEKTSTK